MNRTKASRIGTILALVWLAACIGALSGKCGPAPTDRNPTGIPTATQSPE